MQCCRPQRIQILTYGVGDIHVATGHHVALHRTTYRNTATAQERVAIDALVHSADAPPLKKSSSIITA